MVENEEVVGWNRKEKGSEEPLIWCLRGNCHLILTPVSFSLAIKQYRNLCWHITSFFDALGQHEHDKMIINYNTFPTTYNKNLKITWRPNSFKWW